MTCKECGDGRVVTAMTEQPASSPLIDQIARLRERGVGPDELLALRDRYQETVRSARSSGLLAKLIDRLFHVPSITIGQARELLSVTHASASSNLQKLAAFGIVVEVTGRTRDRMYVAREILGFVGRDLAPTDSSASS